MRYAHALAAAGLLALTACGGDPPPRSVPEYVDDPLLLEATLVRCNQAPQASRDDPDCVNARRAAQRVEARQDAPRRARLEAESEQLRDARRLRQEAEDAARALAEQRAREAEDEAYESRWEPGDGQRADGPLPSAVGNGPPPTILPPPPDSRSRPVEPGETRREADGADD